MQFACSAFQHFISRKAMDIEGIGSETVVQLYEANLLHTIVDLYQLDPAAVLRLLQKVEIGKRNINGIGSTITIDTSGATSSNKDSSNRKRKRKKGRVAGIFPKR